MSARLEWDGRLYWLVMKHSSIVLGYATKLDDDGRWVGGVDGGAREEVPTEDEARKACEQAVRSMLLEAIGGGQ